jgi:hypothetical protein
MSQRIRGQEATIQVIVDGDLKRGTFTKVTSFNLTPRTDIVETPFLGEVEDDLDIQHHGYDFDFEIHHQDSKAFNLLTTVVEQEALRSAHPNVNVVVTIAYRSVSEPALTFVLERCFMKMDSYSFGGRKEYVNSKFSGKCKTLAQVV